MESCTSKWYNLPNDLVERVVKLLDTPTDLLRFRSVCAKWRFSAALTNNNSIPFFSFPLKVPTPTCIDPDIKPSSVRVCESTIYKVSNTSNTKKNSCLVRVEQGSSKDTGKVSLKDPLTPSPFGCSINKFPKVLNLLDLRVTEVCNVHELKFDDDGVGGKLWSPNSMIKKVVASQDKDNFAVMALHRRGKLALWRLGEKKWIQVQDDHEWTKYIDIACHNGKFYAVDIKGLAISISIDCCCQQITYIATPMFRSGFEYYDDRGRYLLNSLGCLLLVDKPPVRGSNVHFNAHKLNEGEGQWVPVNNLGDQMLFLGDDCSFSVVARDFAGCKSNCIYFTVYGYTIYDAYPGYQAWLYDMDDRALKPLSTMPRCPNPFRPPSKWLKSKKKRLAILLGRKLHFPY